MTEIIYPSVFVRPFHTAVYDESGGLDELMPMTHIERLERLPGFHSPLRFAGLHTLNWGPYAANTAAAVHLVAVS